MIPEIPYVPIQLVSNMNPVLPPMDSGDALYSAKRYSVQDLRDQVVYM